MSLLPVSPCLARTSAGNTASGVPWGKSGNDLHYRGYYDILDLAEHCEFEEVAHLPIHGKLPTRDELNAYKAVARCAITRQCPYFVSKRYRRPSHPMDVMYRRFRAGLHPAGKVGHTVSGARDIADKLLALPASILLYRKSLQPQRRTYSAGNDDDSIGGHFSASAAR
ncbi:hypothetical protein KCP77_20355 [Salmonella enterica subsp. enterica]|nr:hypothetical protein KCP77_20355 [Salmonella enterica subsp. enterica]